MFAFAMKKLIFKHFIFYHQIKQTSSTEEELSFRFERKGASFSDPDHRGVEFDDVDDVSEDESLYEFMQLVARDKKRFTGVSFDEILYTQSEEFRMKSESTPGDGSSSQASNKDGRSVHEQPLPKTSDSQKESRKPWWEVILEFIKALGPLILAVLKGNG